VWAYGLDDFKAVWNSADNAKLRDRRPDPNILMPGDELTLPEGKPREYALKTGKHHQIVLKVPIKELRLRILLHQDEPLANASYRLTLDDTAEPRTGTTDGDGVLKEKVRINIPGGLLEIDGRRFRLRFNYIDPLPTGTKESAVGVFSRLANLGYESGGASQTSSPALRSALLLYQTDAGIEATGQLDDETKKQLEKDFGC